MCLESDCYDYYYACGSAFRAESDAKVIIFRETLATPALFLLKKAPKRNLLCSCSYSFYTSKNRIRGNGYYLEKSKKHRNISKI